MKLFKQLIKPAIGLLVIAFLVKQGSLKPFMISKSIDDHPSLLLTAMALYFVLTFIAGYRWYLLVQRGGISTRFSTIFSLHMIGLFFVTLLPGGTGGDVVKGFYIYRDTPSKKGIALTSIVMDRAVGVYALLSWGIIGIMMNSHMAFTHSGLKWNSWFYLAAFVTATCIIGFFFTSYAPSLLNHPGIERLPGKRILKGLCDALQVYRTYPVTLFIAYLMTLMIHGLILLIFILCAISLDVKLPLLQHGFIVPLLTMINGVPISPAGIGVGEAAAESLYGLMGTDKGGEILALFHVLVLFTAFIGAPFYLFYKKKQK